MSRVSVDAGPDFRAQLVSRPSATRIRNALAMAAASRANVRAFRAGREQAVPRPRALVGLAMGAACARRGSAYAMRDIPVLTVWTLSAYQAVVLVASASSATVFATPGSQGAPASCVAAHRSVAGMAIAIPQPDSVNAAKASAGSTVEWTKRPQDANRAVTVRVTA